MPLGGMFLPRCGGFEGKQFPEHWPLVPRALSSASRGIVAKSLKNAVGVLMPAQSHCDGRRAFSSQVGDV